MMAMHSNFSFWLSKVKLHLFLLFLFIRFKAYVNFVKIMSFEAMFETPKFMDRGMSHPTYER
jgi:hypothetical protein